eukprot:CAMPEP_0176277618 /NCGR_PEP_ID=MMETSP0121_2-20121125/48372_1 /TAXON_ID=160619 /ORGANISM="Kryptoperidinium foliaceum, Strain CCMP 1326" /LENGTH=459 /DNA_ID=CAMNT_0017617927 /DNA_START=14 /DNA_END=1393 /DNA_ORIENTATION=+
MASHHSSFVGSFVGRSGLELQQSKTDEGLPLRDAEAGTMSTAATTMNLVTTMIGAGVLALPKVYATVGIPVGVVVTAIGCSISVYLCDILSEAIGQVQKRTKTRMRTVEDVGFACYGDLGRRAARLVINGTFIGKTAVYFVLIGQNLAFLRSPPMYRGWVVLGSSVFMSLAFVRNVSTLEKIAFLGVVCSVIYLCMIIFGSAQARVAGLSEGTDFIKLRDLDRFQILPALSVMLFSFGPTDVLGTVRNNMANQQGMRLSIVASHAAVGFFCAVAGALGFWGFGAEVQDDITQSMCGELLDGKCVAGTKWISGYLLAGAVVLNLGVSIPIDLYCLFSNIEASYPAEAPMPASMNVALRLAVVLFCAVVGLALPFFMEVLEIFCALLIVPGVIWLPLIFARKAAIDSGISRSFMVRLFDGALGLLGFACLVLGLYKSVHELLEAFRTNEGGAANPFAHPWF